LGLGPGSTSRALGIDMSSQGTVEVRSGWHSEKQVVVVSGVPCALREQSGKHVCIFRGSPAMMLSKSRAVGMALSDLWLV